MSAKVRLIVILLAVAVCSLVGVGAYYGWGSYRQSQLKEQSRAASSASRWQELKALAADWSAWDPQNGEAWLLQAKAATELGEWPAAADLLWKIPDGDPRIVPGMIELSKLSFTHLNDPLRGVAACERILRNDPDADGARQQLIWFFAMTLQREKLLGQIREAIERGIEPREAYVYYFLVDTFRSAGAVKLNQQWLQSHPDTEVFLVAQVLQLSDREAGSSETASTGSTSAQSGKAEVHSKLEQVNALLKRFPQNVELLAYKAEECLKVGDAECATNLLAQAPANALEDSRFWRIQGWVHELNNELDDAVSDFREALKRYPLDVVSMNRLAIVERRRQNVAEVERLNLLVERARTLRKGLLKLPAVEIVPPPALRELAKFAQDCGDPLIGPALARRFAR